MEAHRQYLAHQEAVHREAQRIASLSAFKLLRTRSQRGGMRLHRSLQLALVMRSARDLLITPVPLPDPTPILAPAVLPRENRKRRSSGSRMAELVPTKRACLWQETPQPQPQGGAFPGLAEVLQRLLSSSMAPVPTGCRALGTGYIHGMNTRAVEAF
ncbi:immediate early response gene 2 protein [Pelodytes ibericus]